MIAHSPDLARAPACGVACGISRRASVLVFTISLLPKPTNEFVGYHDKHAKTCLLRRINVIDRVLRFTHRIHLMQEPQTAPRDARRYAWSSPSYSCRACAARPLAA